MKHSTFAKSALALAFGLCATGALASTATPVSEDFEGDAFASGINGVTTNNLTWADIEGGSEVSGGKLVVDAADTPTSATIDSTAAAGINAAVGSRNAKFNATVTFVPATDDPEVTGNDLKFALYAKADSGATNLWVYANGGAADTEIALTSVIDQNIEIAFTAANTFTVKVGNSTSDPFTFANSGSISKIEFQGNGEVDNIAFSYDLVDTTITWPTTLSVVSYTVDGVAGDALTASAGTYSIATEPGAAIVITGTTPYGATVTASGTAGTDFAVTTTTSDLGWYFPCTATAGQDGTAANPYEIDSVNALQALRAAVAAGVGADKCYIQTAGIDMSSAGTFAGIGNFTGVYDGGNKTISNIQFSASNYRGLFNQVTGATIKNLTIDTVTFVQDATKEVAGAAFIGKSYGDATYSNLVAKGSIGTAANPCNHNTAGIIARIYSGSPTIVDCANEADIYCGFSKVGGICAIIQNATKATFIRCSNSGTITVPATYVNLDDSSTVDCGKDGVAGIIAYANSACDFTDCENSGTFSCGNVKTDSNKASIGNIIGKCGNVANKDLGGNKGLANTPMIGARAGTITGFQYATVANGVATTISGSPVAGGSYLLEGNAAPAITLADGESVTFDTSLGYTLDETGIVAAEGCDLEATGTTVRTFTAAEQASYEAAQEVPVSGGSYEISATEANYLNDLVDAYDATTVENALAGVTGEQLKDAVLLNQDVVADDAAAAACTFTVTGVKKSGSDVEVKVQLIRSGTILGAIKGTVTLYSATTPNGTYTKQATAEFSTTAEDKAATQTYTAIFSNVSGNFFKAKIE